MAKLKWGVIYNADALSLADIVHFAPLAEQAGADTIWAAEGWRDAFVPLTAMAGHIKQARLGSSIVQMARPPALTALGAQSLAEYTSGRFVLGVGTAPRDWNRDWHGFDVPRPVARIREYIECLRAALAATPASPGTYRGEYYQMNSFMKFLDAPNFPIPIYLAGVNPLMIQLAGSHSDGLILGPLNGTKYIAEVVQPNLSKGLARSGRSKSAVEVCAICICAVDRDEARARDLARHGIAFYATLPYYDIILNPLGYQEEVAAIRAALARGDFAAMFRAVTDEMVDSLALAGTPDAVRRQSRRFEGLADSIILSSPYFGVGREETRANHAAMLEAFAV